MQRSGIYIASKCKHAAKWQEAGYGYLVCGWPGAGRAQVEGLLSQALGRLLAVAEAYPDLKASTNFSELQRALQEVEDALQLSRRYYNGAVRQLNILVEQFPSNLVANQFDFRKAEYFEIEDAAERAVPKVAF